MRGLPGARWLPALAVAGVLAACGGSSPTAPGFESPAVQIATGPQVLRITYQAVCGYASTSRWRAKAAYDPTVETSVYVRHDAVGRGIGSTLYAALFDAIATEDVNTVVAGMTLPNATSRALHEKFGFREVGVFSRVGRKFGQYWDVGWFQRALKL